MKIYQVDSFTNEKFKGNPAGVCILEKAIREELMQSLALEMDISETAFLYKDGDSYRIRFFAPESEVNLCGHATLAASHILFENEIEPENEVITFKANTSILKTRKENGKIKMEFPVLELTERTDYLKFEEAAGIAPKAMFDTNDHWTLVELENEDELKNLKPDQNKLMQNGLGDIVVTAKAKTAGFDYVLRCFAPAVGIAEDPATGSAQCALAPYWHKKTGQTEFKAKQLSKRTGIFDVKYNVNNVSISGSAVTLFEIKVIL